MKFIKTSFLNILIVICTILIVGCNSKSELQPQYKLDNDNLKQAIILLNKSRDLSNPPVSETQSSFRLSDEVEKKIIEYLVNGIRYGKLVSDDYLDYLHPEMKHMFKNRLIKGAEIYHNGLINNNEGNIEQGAKIQIKGNRLVIEWIDWFDTNGEEITRKVFQE